MSVEDIPPEEEEEEPFWRPSSLFMLREGLREVGVRSGLLSFGLPNQFPNQERCLALLLLLRGLGGSTSIDVDGVCAEDGGGWEGDKSGCSVRGAEWDLVGATTTGARVVVVGCDVRKGIETRSLRLDEKMGVFTIVGGGVGGEGRKALTGICRTGGCRLGGWADIPAGRGLG